MTCYYCSSYSSYFCFNISLWWLFWCWITLLTCHSFLVIMTEICSYVSLYFLFFSGPFWFVFYTIQVCIVSFDIRAYVLFFSNKIHLGLDCWKILKKEKWSEVFLRLFLTESCKLVVIVSWLKCCVSRSRGHFICFFVSNVSFVLH